MNGSEQPELWVKICGVTNVQDAQLVKAAGADAIGLNFAAPSPRCISIDKATEIANALAGEIELVGVFVDMPQDEIRRHMAVGLHSAQLHGVESPEQLKELQRNGVSAYKALRIGSSEDVAQAASFFGEKVLVDAKVKGAMGGTGHTFDWSLIRGLNASRKMILAGGLKPSNVAEAVASVRPFGVDTASGVELATGMKDENLVREFIVRAKRAWTSGVS